MTERNAYELLQLVAEHYRGARYAFIRARLSLQTRLDLEQIRPEDDDPEVAERLAKAIRAVCPDVNLEGR